MEMQKKKFAKKKDKGGRKAETPWITAKALAKRWGYSRRGAIEAAERLGVRAMRMGGGHAPLRFDLADIERVERERIGGGR